MTVTFKVDGLREFERELEQFSKTAGKGVLRRALLASAVPLAEKMRQLAPKDDQDLFNSIGVGTRLSKKQQSLHRKMFRDDRSAVEVFVGAGSLPQAHLQEFGTQFHPPQPFARPAWESDKNQLLARLSGELRNEIDKAAVRMARRAARINT